MAGKDTPVDLITRRSPLDLSRSAARAIEPYAWEAANQEIAARYGLEPAQIVRYDTNTAPLPPPCLDAVLDRARAEPWVNEYFDGSYAALAAALADYTGYGPEHLVIGAGADEVIDVLGKTFLDAGDTVVIPAPTYSLYRIVAGTMDARVRSVPSHGDLRFEVQALIEAARGAKALFLCNPNNPTGLALAPDELARLVRAVDCMVILDEAYAEYAGESALALIQEESRLAIVRTLSKAFALAGARIGYAVCAPATAALANRMRPPNSISYISALLGEAALGDLGSMRAAVAAVVEQRDRLAAALGEMGLTVTPSVANFVLARWPSAASAAESAEACLARGLVLRTYGPGHPLASYLRITARTPEQTGAVIARLQECKDVGLF